MPATEAIPVTITPEADAFIEEVGQRREFEAMIEHARRTIADLRGIEVILDDTPETGPPGIVLWAHRDDPSPGDDPTHGEWIEWLVERFPPEVCQNFVLLSHYHKGPPSGPSTFEETGAPLDRLSPTTQERLEALMDRHNQAELTGAERDELRALVREAEDVTLRNARRLTARRRQSGGE